MDLPTSSKLSWLRCFSVDTVDVLLWYCLESQQCLRLVLSKLAARQVWHRYESDSELYRRGIVVVAVSRASAALKIKIVQKR